MFTVESRGHDYYAYMGPAYWHVVIMFIGFLWAGTMRVSPLRRLLGPAHYALAYSIMFCTLRGAMVSCAVHYFQHSVIVTATEGRNHSQNAQSP